MFGEGFTIQFSSADASAGAAIVLYDRDGNVRALAASERVVIYSLSGYAAAAAGRVDVFTDANANSTVDAGERILSYEAAGALSGGPDGYACAKGVLPKVKAAAAGQVTLTGTCAILKNRADTVTANV